MEDGATVGSTIKVFNNYGSVVNFIGVYPAVIGDEENEYIVTEPEKSEGSLLVFVGENEEKSGLFIPNEVDKSVIIDII